MIFDDDKKLRVFMIILFILTLLSLYLGVFLIIVITSIKNVPDEMAFNYSWVFLCFLPLTILSIVLGYKFKKRIRCKKNIVAGFIMTFILLCFGLMALDPVKPISYQEFLKYQEYLNVNLPSDGLYLIDALQSDSTDVVFRNVYYQRSEETTKLFNEIRESNYWIAKEDLSTNLSWLNTYKSCVGFDTCYYSFYIKELDSYNTYPTKTGDYHILVMHYDADNTMLRLNEYLFHFKE